MSRDLLADSYGRFYEIPAGLARRGHHVDLVCLSYRKLAGVDARMDDNLSVRSYNLGVNPAYGFTRYYRQLHRLISEFVPDVIIAASDCYQVITGASLASRHSIPFIADLYDNFEAYKASHLPGVLPWFYRSLASAQAITVVSDQLRQYLHQKLVAQPSLHVIENAVADMFLSGQDRQLAREHFGFDPEAIYIGTAGDLADNKGINALLQAYMQLAAVDKRLHLVLAGNPGKWVARQRYPNLHLPGQLDHNEIPGLFDALDTGVICIRDNVFGRYCFPQKFHEMVARKLPLVAAAVGEMSTLLANNPQQLYRPDDVEDLKRAICYQLQHRHSLPDEVPTWEVQAERFERVILEVLDR
jgi:glycosyltransferase involved in cell wall biosynthesis